jgi:hypothetical protein
VGRWIGGLVDCLALQLERSGILHGLRQDVCTEPRSRSNAKYFGAAAAAKRCERCACLPAGRFKLPNISILIANLAIFISLLNHYPIIFSKLEPYYLIIKIIT